MYVGLLHNTAGNFNTQNDNIAQTNYCNRSNIYLGNVMPSLAHKHFGNVKYVFRSYKGRLAEKLCLNAMLCTRHYQLFSIFCSQQTLQFCFCLLPQMVIEFFCSLLYLHSMQLQPTRPTMPLQHGAVQAVRPQEWRGLSQLPPQHSRAPLSLLQGGLLQGHDQAHFSPQSLQR